MVDNVFSRETGMLCCTFGMYNFTFHPIDYLKTTRIDVSRQQISPIRPFTRKNSLKWKGNLCSAEGRRTEKTQKPLKMAVFRTILEIKPNIFREHTIHTPSYAQEMWRIKKGGLAQMRESHLTIPGLHSLIP
jgi:hypothetical protein